MKRKKAALYNPYLDILGGGEKHTLSILKVLDDEGVEISVFWNHNLSTDIAEKFNLRFTHLSFLPNIFRMKKSFVRKIDELKKFDYFFYVTDGSYFLSSAKKNYIFAMVPNHKLYQQTFMNKLKTFNYRFICNSRFTQTYLARYGIRANVCYPYIDDEYIQLPLNSIKKENIILSVARFFPQLHTKKHDVIIKAFQELRRTNSKFKNYQLHLVGGLKDEDKAYFNKLKDMAGGDRQVVFRTNVTAKELFGLYSKARFFWHFTGFGEDEVKTPEKVEHLGISPLEAMATGAITFCYRAGGPKEIISEGKTGFLFSTIDELTQQMTATMKSPDKMRLIPEAAKGFVAANFSYQIFRNTVKKLL